MRKRQYKKNARNSCPRCGSQIGVGTWYETTTRKLIPVFIWCADCRWSRYEDKKIKQEVQWEVQGE